MIDGIYFVEYYAPRFDLDAYFLNNQRGNKMKNYIVSTIDGLPIENTFNIQKENEVAALTAALSGLSKGLREDLDLGEIGTIIISGDKGCYGMRYIDNERILGMMASDVTSENELLADIDNLTFAMQNNEVSINSLAKA